MATVDVVVVGCGAVNRGMGWYHAKQVAENRVPGARLSHIVDPWFAGEAKSSDQGLELANWVSSLPSVGFHSSVADLPKAEGNVLALVAGRTPDNPGLVHALVEGSHCTHIFLEKPGAPTWKSLEEVSSFVQERGIHVYVGYVRGACDYVNAALELAGKTENSSLSFTVSNAVTVDELGECFNRNPEGIIRNMVIHEIALLAERFGATADSVQVSFDKEASKLIEAGGRSDFSKAKFTLVTKEGVSITLIADRCGGSYCEAAVTVGGIVQQKFLFPDAALQERIKVLQEASPNCFAYLLLQDEIYANLKSLCIQHILDGKSGTPHGLVLLPVAVEALRLAEKVTSAAEEDIPSTTFPIDE